MMERLALEQFKAWKDNGKRKPLLVTGVRQCGKTYLIRNFGETEFEETTPRLSGACYRVSRQAFSRVI